jgi:hypothetical protein
MLTHKDTWAQALPASLPESLLRTINFAANLFRTGSSHSRIPWECEGSLDQEHILLYDRPVGSHPPKKDRPSAMRPWSLVDPFLAVSNQVIILAESLTALALAALESLPPGPTASTLRTTSESPGGQELGASAVAPFESPEIPVSPELHVLPCGPGDFFLWFRLPPTALSEPLQLREISAATRAETRRLTLAHGDTSTYIEAPEASGLHWIEIGYPNGEHWTPLSTVAGIRSGPRVAPKQPADGEPGASHR